MRLRYVKREGFFEVHRPTGEHHFWDTNDFIWDNHLKYFVDEHGNPKQNILVKPPVRVTIYDLHGTNTSLQNQIDRLNLDSTLLDNEVKEYVNDNTRQTI